jgi:hypothetical protein
MLPNGNVLMISWESKTAQEVLAAGLSPGQIPASGTVWSEMIMEYSPTLDQIVWAWHLWDHALPIGWDAADHPEKIDLAYAATTRTEDWFHINSIDYSDDRDHIVVSVRGTSEIWIIDHGLSSTAAAGTAGDLLYRFGNEAAHGGSEAQILVAQHDAEFIDADTLLVFDNGSPRSRPYSRVVEIDLPAYENGQFESADIAWQYGEATGAAFFFSDHISGSQRLKSGNTLICSGVEGRFFEVTPAGETVWEYVNPYASTSPDGEESNEVFRCERYEKNAVELQGVSLEDVASTVPTTPSPGQPPADGSNSGSGEGPQGILSVAPAFLLAGASNQLVNLTLDPQFAPPPFIQFTHVVLGGVAAAHWTRDGEMLRAWFDIPASVTRGVQSLTVTFPGRSGETITFTAPIEVR